MVKRKTVYYLDQEKVDAGAIGNHLFLQDLGFTMVAGQHYDVTADAVSNSEELSAALRMGWVRKKQVPITPTKEPSPEPSPEETEAPPPEPSPKSVPSAPPTTEEDEREEAPPPDTDDSKQRTRESLGELFDLAIKAEVINETRKGNFTLLDKDGEGYLRFKSRDNAIDRFSEDESLTQHVQNLIP